MKIRSIFILVAILGSGLCLTQRSTAALSLPWHTVDGGGGASISNDGRFSVSGTVGQPDAGVSASPQHSLYGGFWPLFAAQTEGNPSLRIFLANPSTAVVAWPSPSTGWVLQQNTNSLSSLNWSNVSAAIQDDGAEKSVSVPVSGDLKFFRLRFGL